LFGYQRQRTLFFLISLLLSAAAPLWGRLQVRKFYEGCDFLNQEHNHVMQPFIRVGNGFHWNRIFLVFHS